MNFVPLQEAGNNRDPASGIFLEMQSVRMTLALQLNRSVSPWRMVTVSLLTTKSLQNS